MENCASTFDSSCQTLIENYASFRVGSRGHQEIRVDQSGRVLNPEYQDNDAPRPKKRIYMLFCVYPSVSWNCLGLFPRTISVSVTGRVAPGGAELRILLMTGIATRGGGGVVRGEGELEGGGRNWNVNVFTVNLP